MSDHKKQIAEEILFSFEEQLEWLICFEKAFQDDTLGITQIYKWFSHFKKGDMLAENQPQSGRASESGNDISSKIFSQAINEDG